MIVVKELAAELQIEFAAELFDSFHDVAGLYRHIFFAIKTDFHIQPHLQKTSITIIPHIQTVCKVFLKNTIFLFSRQAPVKAHTFLYFKEKGIGDSKKSLHLLYISAANCGGAILNPVYYYVKITHKQNLLPNKCSCGKM